MIGMIFPFSDSKRISLMLKLYTKHQSICTYTVYIQSHVIRYRLFAKVSTEQKRSTVYGWSVLLFIGIR